MVIVPTRCGEGGSEPKGEMSFLYWVAECTLKGEELSHPGGACSRAAAPSHGRRPGQVFQACHSGWKPRGRPKTRLRAHFEALCCHWMREEIGVVKGGGGGRRGGRGLSVSVFQQLAEVVLMLSAARLELETLNSETRRDAEAVRAHLQGEWNLFESPVP